MLKHIKVVPLAAESLGVRSMCTYVETPDLRILLDAGVSLCPNRSSLPPHPQEYNAINECRRTIQQKAERADIVTVSHYHFDHHTPSFEDWSTQWTEAVETAKQIYQGKTVLVKDPKEKINYSQRHRGWMFQRTGGAYAKRIEVADGKAFFFGDTAIRFSEPVFHVPEGSQLGWVLMAIIENNGEKLMFAPDVQGPISQHTLDLILRERPQLIFMGGPPLYLAGFKVNERQMQSALQNLGKVVESITNTILDHHLLRDSEWKEKLTDVFYKAYELDHTVLTAAEFLNQKNRFLEADRKKLFSKDPPTKEFEKWMKTSEEARKHVKPPV
jgi:predicted metallo-beta-lactamase superfamily hydrolase